MREKPIQHHIESLAALLLFGVFAVCVLAVLLTGADAYRGLTQRAQEAYDRRSCTQYIATRVRQADYAQGIAVDKDFGGGALVLDAKQKYRTWLYCQDGWLMELYCLAAEPLEPESGQKLMEAEDMELSLQDDLLTVRLTTPQGETDTLLLSLRGGEGEEAAP